MARLFSVLSGSVPSELTSDFFDSRSISDGINKRNGLIASRSIVSTDVYEDLEAVNIDGSRGTYFPPDLLTAPDNPFIGEAYTSSIAGIVIPNDYRTRPTASVLSTTAGVGPTNPLDTASVSYTSYLAASTAVKTVLDSITDGGPYGRSGFNASRTLHGTWHDQELGYFAWDDFTPGQLPTPAVSAFGAGPVAATLDISALTFEYTNDTNPAAPIFIQLSIAPTNTEPELADRGNCTRTLNIPSGSILLDGTPVTGTGDSNCTGGGNSTWAWDGVGNLTWTINTGGGELEYSGYYRIHDPVIQAHTSTSQTGSAIHDAGGAPAAGPPPPPPPIDYCVESCSAITFEADHPDCGAPCPNCEFGICIG